MVVAAPKKLSTTKIEEIFERPKEFCKTVIEELQETAFGIVVGENITEKRVWWKKNVERKSNDSRSHERPQKFDLRIRLAFLNDLFW